MHDPSDADICGKIIADIASFVLLLYGVKSIYVVGVILGFEKL
jgi:hypothetical protein